MKPSAVSEVMVEVSQVTWSDIGGLDGLKLRQAVEWPEVLTRMDISAQGDADVRPTATGLLQDNESSGQ